MSSLTRLQYLNKLSETLTQIVEKSLHKPSTPEKIIEDKTSKPELKFTTLGSVGPGTSVMIPENPIKTDGSVDIIINIRGIPGGDVKAAGSLGKNAVVITAEAGGVGSKENQQQYGHANFINSAVNKVLSFLKNKFPDKNIKRGKLVISGFSGGGGAVASLLTQRNQILGDVDAIIINDGLHASLDSSAMQAVLQYAKDAQKDPSKQFNLIHTAVVPGKYPSTTETAEYILKNLGLTRQPVDQWSGVGQKPVSQAASGGVKITQLYNQQQPYMAKDQTGKLRPNVLGATSGGQHISSLQWMPNAFQDLKLF